MIPRTTLVILALLFSGSAFADSKLFDPTTAPDNTIAVPLGVESGSANDRGRDTRVFTIPVSCSGEKGIFSWSGSGQTVITATYAKKINAQIAENEELKGYLGGDGIPLFLGDTAIEMELGGKKHLAT